MDSLTLEKVLKIMIKTAEEPMSGNIVTNKEIYQKASLCSNFNKHNWGIIKPFLRKIAESTDYEVDGVNYQINAYSPMCRGQYNFYFREEYEAIDPVEIPEINPRVISGFMIGQK